MEGRGNLVEWGKFLLPAGKNRRDNSFNTLSLYLPFIVLIL